MTFLQSRILAAQVNKALYAVRVSHSPFTIAKSAYINQALNILNEVKVALNNGGITK